MKWNSNKTLVILLVVCYGMLPLYFYAAIFAVEDLFIGLLVYYGILLVIYLAIKLKIRLSEIPEEVLRRIRNQD